MSIGDLTTVIVPDNPALLSAAALPVNPALVGGTVVLDEPVQLPFRQIANRSYVPNQLSGSATSAMSRTTHFARGDISSLKLAFANWFVNAAASGVEAGTGGTKTVEASIEYPADTFTRVTFDEANVGSVSDSATLVSDETPVSIPDGAQFWVRQYIECQGSGKVAYTTPASAGTIAMTGEATEVPAVSNKVMGGAVAGPAQVYPAGIFGRTAQNAVLVVGDSRAFGEAGDATMQDTGEIAPSVQVGVINAGVPSDRAMWFKASSSLRRGLAAYCSDVICQYGINDIRGGGSSLSTLQADVKAVYALFPDSRIWQSTIEPGNTSTDNWATLANQAVASTSVVRAGFNDWLRLLYDETISMVELISNGDFSSGTTGWSGSTGASLSVVNVGGVNRLRVTNTVNGLTRANQSITTVAGQKYIISAQLIAGTAPTIALRIGTTAGGADIAQQVGAGLLQVAFTATGTTTWIGLANGSTTLTGQYNEFAFVTTVPDLSTDLAGYFDVADALESSRNSGKWKVNGTPFYATVDGLHPSQTGYTLVRDSGAINDFT